MKCKRPYCHKDAAPDQVYCSKDCAPYGRLGESERGTDYERIAQEKLSLINEPRGPLLPRNTHVRKP